MTDILVTITGTMILAFAGLFWWMLQDMFRRNENEHTDIKQDAKETRKDVRTVSGKLSHVIRYHENIPPYDGEE